MRKVMAGLMAVTLFFPLMLHAQPEKITIGCGNFRPMFFHGERGMASGRDVDLWRLWSQRTGIAVEFRIMEWAEVIPSLLNHDIDVVNGASYTPERAKSMAFTKPHQDLRAYLFFHNSMQPFRDISDLHGNSIGVMKGSNIEEYLRLNVPDAKIRTCPDYETLVAVAMQGMVKTFIAEEPLISYYITMAGGANEFRRSANIVLDSNLCMAVRLEDQDLLNTINEGFAAITQAERHQIDEGWFGLDDHAKSKQWHFWIFMLVGIGISLLTMTTLARTWERELPNIQSVRNKFINMWIVFAAILALPIFLIDILRAVELGWLPLYNFHALLVAFIIAVAIFRKRIHYYVRTLLVLAGLYFLGLSGLVVNGIVGPTLLPLMTLLMVSVILFGIKGGILAVLMSLTTIGSIGVAVQLDLLTPSYDVYTYSGSLGVWSMSFTLLLFMPLELDWALREYIGTWRKHCMPNENLNPCSVILWKQPVI